MPLTASEVWKSWLANTESDLLSVPRHYDWPMDKLITVTRTVLAPSAELPDELLQLREKAIQPSSQVSDE